MRRNTENFLISCDWGTSRFRLRLFNINTHQIIHESQTSQGIAQLNVSLENGLGSRERQDFFLRYLQSEVCKLPVEAADGSLPIFISGMASAAIGIRELPYASIPLDLDLQQFVIEQIPSSESCKHTVVLISGVSSDREVMRGEETQILGLQHMISPKHDEFIYLLPGTHSKHVFMHKHSIMRFDTYLTGELFDILIKHSLLRDAVERPAGSKMTHEQEAAFRFGVHDSLKPLLNGIFYCRTNMLFKHLSLKNNYFYLSGLLIGNELGVLSRAKLPIYLAAAGSLSSLYAAASEILDMSSKMVIIPPEIVERSAGLAHLLIYKNLKESV